MPSPTQPTELPFPAGQLETLALRALELGEETTKSGGEIHGYGIARLIERQSGQQFKVEEGSLYPALRRLETRGDVEAFWGESETGRKARFYRLTLSGRKRLAADKSAWITLASVMGSMLGTSVPTPKRGTA